MWFDRNDPSWGALDVLGLFGHSSMLLSPLLSIPIDPLSCSNWLLSASGVEVSVYHQERLPQTKRVLVVSNHRSIMDAPLLMQAIGRPVRFACHHYMSQVPGLREIVTALGCVPLDEPGQQKSFFQRAEDLLRSQQAVGIFPEGAKPMIQVPPLDSFNEFHRGFAHLALRAEVPDLAVLPIAIAPSQESQNPMAPLQLFQWFDPSEPMFQQPGWHPLVLYQKVQVFIGNPIWISEEQHQQYNGKQAGRLAKELTQSCNDEIASLLRKSSYFR